MTEKKRGRRQGVWRRASKINRAKEPDFEKIDLSPSSRRSGPLILLLAALILLGIAAVFFLPSFLTPTPDARQDRREELEIDWEGPLPREVIARFRQKTGPGEKLKLLDHHERVEGRAREFFLHGPGKTEEIMEISRIKKPIEGPDFSKYLRLVARMKDGGSRMIMLNVDPTGPKIDFDFYSRYCEVPWADFLTGPMLESREMRVMLQEEHYYHGEFADDQTWQSFKGISPDLDGSVLLYLRRDRPFQKNLLTMVRRGQGVRTNLALKTSPESKKERAFEIIEVNALNWLGLENGPVSREDP